MAKTKTLRVSLHRKLSDDKYGSYGAEVSLEVELEEGDSKDKVFKKVLSSAEEDLKLAVRASKLKLSSKNSD
jgi:hypothetical protein